MFFKTLKSNRDFSLIELMVVVAIIAILSTIAIPSYQTFQAKARQKEGFALLGGYFQAAQASRAEYNFFPGDFVGTGFAPVGTLSYHLRVGDNATALPYGQIQDPACTDTGQACACAAQAQTCPSYKEWVMAVPAGAAGVIGPIMPATAAVASTANAFIAHAAGFISTKAAVQDEYSIDHVKNLLMVTDGIK